MYNQLFAQAKKNVKEETAQIKETILSNHGTLDINTIITSNRITLIQNDGKVIFDNFKNFEKMDNHQTRPEIIALNSDITGESTRLSDTLGKQTYYYAERAGDNTILRLSITIDSVYSLLLKTIPHIIIITLFVLLISALVSKYLTKKIISPLYNINEETYDELDLFYKKIRKQKNFIETQTRELSQKSEEFNILTENIADGFILLNAKSEIISTNKNAVKIFGKTNNNYLSKNIIQLNRSDELRTAIDQAYQGENSETTMEIKNRQYILHIAPINNNHEIRGVVILVIDNTAKAQAEKIRQEFSANVSHELKTPLTSILGYAELIKTGMAKSQDIQRFSEKIYKESQTLIDLIEDIIKISKIDEINLKYDEKRVNLKELLENNISRLEILRKQKNIEFHTELENLKVSGIKNILDETLYNILDNAIKYNTQNGAVHVKLYKEGGETLISIADTGIGIPKESLDRIFERFYRADTSHSGNIKGTGLGLSIVKHAIALHKGKISVESEPSKGTKITIKLA